MTGLLNIQKVFLIGIGGIGMSALARYFKERGCQVAGYDRTRSPLTNQLATSGIAVCYSDEITQEAKEAELIIYTPAIPEDNAVYRYALLAGKPLYKRSEVLQEILKQMDTIAVAGSHGKTTISCMIAHILRDSGLGCHAFLGGIAANYNTNYWSDKGALAVVEADEYDRSFLRLSPDKAVLTAMDPDHLDIYGSAENMRQAFTAFTHNINPQGLLVYKKQLAGSFGGDRKLTYDLKDPEAGIYARNLRVAGGGYSFDVVIRGGEVMRDARLPVGGRHNVENALAAMAICYDAGVAPGEIKKALATFKGVKRRFEYVIRRPDIVYIDDYAHHPEELKMLLTGVKELYPNDPCVIVFQPHLYSRTKELAADFASALNLADKVILLPVYPAREVPVEGVSSKLIADMMPGDKVALCEKESLCDQLKHHPNKIVITAGAGDIGTMVEEVETCLMKMENNITHVS